MMLMILLLQFNSFYSGFNIICSCDVNCRRSNWLNLYWPSIRYCNDVGVIALAGIVVNNNITIVILLTFLKKTNNVKEAIVNLAQD